MLTEPWHGGADATGVVFALAAAACWAAYILLTQRVGDEVAGITGLAVSMPVAGLISMAVGGPSLVPELDLELLLLGVGLAILVPLVPFALEMLALRRLTTTAFGTLMSLEPAVALAIGFVALGQRPSGLPVIGVLFVVAAGVGAERTGATRARSGARLGVEDAAERHATSGKGALSEVGGVDRSRRVTLAPSPRISRTRARSRVSVRQ